MRQEINTVTVIFQPVFLAADWWCHLLKFTCCSAGNISISHSSLQTSPPWQKLLVPPPMDAGDSCTVTIIFVDIDWDKVSLSPSPCCTDISPHFFARHWWVPWWMMLTFPPPPSNSSNILPITLGSLRMHHVMRRAYVKRRPPTCVRIWKLNTDTLLHFCFLFFYYY